jgi:hypothetical protein
VPLLSLTVMVAAKLRLRCGDYDLWYRPIIMRFLATTGSADVPRAAHLVGITISALNEVAQ